MDSQHKTGYFSIYAKGGLLVVFRKKKRQDYPMREIP